MKLSDILKEAKAPQAQIDAALEQEAAIEAANSEAGHHRKSKATLKDQLAAFGDLDPAKVKEIMANASKLEQDSLKAAGKYDEALKTATSDLTAQVESLKTSLGSKDKALSSALIDTAILTAIDGKAINNGQVAALLKGSIKLDGDAVVVMDGDKPRYNSKNEKMSVAELAEDFLNKNAHMVVGKGGGAGSGGNNGGQDKNNANTVTREVFEAMDPAARSKHSMEGGKVTDSA